MSLKQRVRKLETSIGGKYDLAELLRQSRMKHEELSNRLEAMSEAELIYFAFDTEIDHKERCKALKLLIDSGTNSHGAADTLQELQEAEVKNMRNRAQSTGGRERSMLLRLADGTERGYRMGMV